MIFAKTYFAKTLLLSATMLGSLCFPPLANSAQAGFDFSTSSLVGLGAQKSSVARPESDPNAPALQVLKIAMFLIPSKRNMIFQTIGMMKGR